MWSCNSSSVFTKKLQYYSTLQYLQYYADFSSNGHHWPLLYCSSQNWVRLRQFDTFIYGTFFDNKASLNKRAVQLLAWLRIFVSVGWVHAAVPYSWPMLLNPCGELPRGLSCFKIHYFLMLYSEYTTGRVWLTLEPLSKKYADNILLAPIMLHRKS